MLLPRGFHVDTSVKQCPDQEMCLVVDSETVRLIFDADPAVGGSGGGGSGGGGLMNKLPLSLSKRNLLDSGNPLIPRFLALTRLMKSVICARVSPDQQAQVVRAVRRHDPGPLSLAVGHDDVAGPPLPVGAGLSLGLAPPAP